MLQIIIKFKNDFKNNFQGFVTNCHNFFLTYPEFRLEKEVTALAAPKKIVCMRSLN